MIPLIEEHRGELEELCRRMHVERLDLFGSATTGEFEPGRSDLDFIVTFTPPYRGDPYLYLSLAEELEALFACRVDLLIDKPFRNPIFRAEVEASRRRLYEQNSEQAAA